MEHLRYSIASGSDVARSYVGVLADRTEGAHTSKTAQVYTGWDEIRNRRNGRYSFDAAPLQPGSRISALAFGMSKRF